MKQDNTQKVLILSSPSGGGKTTIMHRLLEQISSLEFSISACSRAPREGEIDGKDYYFFSEETFREKIDQVAFLEWEEVYPGKFYGTLKSELQRIWEKGHYVVFDVDVVGGINLKKHFGAQALAIFIMPSSVEILRERLLARGSETPESIATRLARAEFELTYSDKYDVIILNENLSDAVAETYNIVQYFLNENT